VKGGDAVLRTDYRTAGSHGGQPLVADSKKPFSSTGA